MQRKLTLDLAALCVETFETGRDDAPGRGTVHGHAAPPQSQDMCVEPEPATIGLTCLEPCGSILCYPTEYPQCMSIHDVCPLY